MWKFLERVANQKRVNNAHQQQLSSLRSGENPSLSQSGKDVEARSINALSDPLKKAGKKANTISDALSVLQQQGAAGNAMAQKAYDTLTSPEVTTSTAHLEANGKTDAQHQELSTGGYQLLPGANVYINPNLKGLDLMATLVHESYHLNVPKSDWGEYSDEIDGHAYEEQYRIDSGFPSGGPDFRTKDKATGKTVPDINAIGKWLETRGYIPGQ